MGTRCMVIIKDGDTKINLYRHWDGYLSETGYDLATRLFHCFNKTTGYASASKFFDIVFNAQRTPYIHDEPNKRQYELTNQIHGDVDFIYRFTFDEYRSGAVNVNINERTAFKADGKHEWETVWSAPVLLNAEDGRDEDASAFVDFMLNQKIEMRKRAEKIAL